MAFAEAPRRPITARDLGRGLINALDALIRPMGKNDKRRDNRHDTQKRTDQDANRGNGSGNPPSQQTAEDQRDNQRRDH